MFEKKHIEKIREPQSLPDFVYDALKEAIITGKVAAGTRLKQMDIADQLSVSQQTVREALTSLVATGLVEQIPHRGFEVTCIPLKEQEEIYKLRTTLETFAAEEAMEKITPEDLATMRELLPNTASPDGTIPIERVREANRAFHMVPVKATRNRNLIRILEQLWDITWTYFYNEDAENQKNSATKELEEHAALITALEKKDLSAARKTLKFHIKDSFASIRDYINHCDLDGK